MLHLHAGVDALGDSDAQRINGLKRRGGSQLQDSASNGFVTLQQRFR